jgi:hypothetical protein
MRCKPHTSAAVVEERTRASMSQQRWHVHELAHRNVGMRMRLRIHGKALCMSFALELGAHTGDARQCGHRLRCLDGGWTRTFGALVCRGQAVSGTPVCGRDRVQIVGSSVCARELSVWEGAQSVGGSSVCGRESCYLSILHQNKSSV